MYLEILVSNHLVTFVKWERLLFLFCTDIFVNISVSKRDTIVLYLGNYQTDQVYGFFNLRYFLGTNFKSNYIS